MKDDNLSNNNNQIINKDYFTFNNPKKKSSPQNNKNSGNLSNLYSKSSLEIHKTFDIQFKKDIEEFYLLEGCYPGKIHYLKSNNLYSYDIITKEIINLTYEKQFCNNINYYATNINDLCSDMKKDIINNECRFNDLNKSHNRHKSNLNNEYTYKIEGSTPVKTVKEVNNNKNNIINSFKVTSSVKNSKKLIKVFQSQNNNYLLLLFSNGEGELINNTNTRKYLNFSQQLGDIGRNNKSNNSLDSNYKNNFNPNFNLNLKFLYIHFTDDLNTFILHYKSNIYLLTKRSLSCNNFLYFNLFSLNFTKTKTCIFDQIKYDKAFTFFLNKAVLTMELFNKENFVFHFGNNYHLGSFIRINYTWLLPLTKITSRLFLIEIIIQINNTGKIFFEGDVSRSCFNSSLNTDNALSKEFNFEGNFYNDACRSFMKEICIESVSKKRFSVDLKYEYEGSCCDTIMSLINNQYNDKNDKKTGDMRMENNSTCCYNSHNNVDIILQKINITGNITSIVLNSNVIINTSIKSNNFDIIDNNDKSSKACDDISKRISDKNAIKTINNTLDDLKEEEKNTSNKNSLKNVNKKQSSSFINNNIIDEPYQVKQQGYVIMFFHETGKIFSYSLKKLFQQQEKIKSSKNNNNVKSLFDTNNINSAFSLLKSQRQNNNNYFINSLDWVSNDLYLCLNFGNNSFFLINTCFQIIPIVEFINKSPIGTKIFNNNSHNNTKSNVCLDKFIIDYDKIEDDKKRRDYFTFNLKVFTINSNLVLFYNKRGVYSLFINASEIERELLEFCNNFKQVNELCLENSNNNYSKNYNNTITTVENKINIPTFSNNDNDNKNISEINNPPIQDNILTQSFEDFLYMITYYQLYFNETENLVLFDKIHNYIISLMSSLYQYDLQQGNIPNEKLGNTFSMIVKFILVFKKLKLIRDTNLNIIAYFLGVSNDFFYYLINYKELWLATLFVNLMEEYMLCLVTNSSKNYFCYSKSMFLDSENSNYFDDCFSNRKNTIGLQGNNKDIEAESFRSNDSNRVKYNHSIVNTTNNSLGNNNYNNNNTYISINNSKIKSGFIVNNNSNYINNSNTHTPTKKKNSNNISYINYYKALFPYSSKTNFNEICINNIDIINNRRDLIFGNCLKTKTYSRFYGYNSDKIFSLLKFPYFNISTEFERLCFTISSNFSNSENSLFVNINQNYFTDIIRDYLDTNFRYNNIEDLNTRTNLKSILKLFIRKYKLKNVYNSDIIIESISEYISKNSSNSNSYKEVNYHEITHILDNIISINQFNSSYIIEQQPHQPKKQQLKEEQLIKNAKTTHKAKKQLNNNNNNNNNTLLNINNSIIRTIPSSRFLNTTQTPQFTKLRILLILICITELRNTQALNINSLYYILAKYNLTQLLKSNQLNDFDIIASIIKKNYLFLVNENSKKKNDQFQLNAIKYNSKTEIASMLLHSSDPNEFLAFDFFSEFFPLSEMYSFLEISCLFCAGNDEELFTSLSSMNHVGILPKWLLLLRNGLYEYLFEDVKEYCENHIKCLFENDNKDEDFDVDYYNKEDNTDNVGVESKKEACSSNYKPIFTVLRVKKNNNLSKKEEGHYDNGSEENKHNDVDLNSLVVFNIHTFALNLIQFLQSIIKMILEKNMDIGNMRNNYSSFVNSKDYSICINKQNSNSIRNSINNSNNTPITPKTKLKLKQKHDITKVFELYYNQQNSNINNNSRCNESSKIKLLTPLNFSFSIYEFYTKVDRKEGVNYVNDSLSNDFKRLISKCYHSNKAIINNESNTYNTDNNNSNSNMMFYYSSNKKNICENEENGVFVDGNNINSVLFDIIIKYSTEFDFNIDQVYGFIDDLGIMSLDPLIDNNIKFDIDDDEDNDGKIKNRYNYPFLSNIKLDHYFKININNSNNSNSINNNNNSNNDNSYINYLKSSINSKTNIFTFSNNTKSKSTKRLLIKQLHHEVLKSLLKDNFPLNQTLQVLFSKSESTLFKACLFLVFLYYKFSLTSLLIKNEILIDINIHFSPILRKLYLESLFLTLSSSIKILIISVSNNNTNSGGISGERDKSKNLNKEVVYSNISVLSEMLVVVFNKYLQLSECDVCYRINCYEESKEDYNSNNYNNSNTNEPNINSIEDVFWYVRNCKCVYSVIENAPTYLLPFFVSEILFNYNNNYKISSNCFYLGLNIYKRVELNNEIEELIKTNAFTDNNSFNNRSRHVKQNTISHLYFSNNIKSNKINSKEEINFNNNDFILISSIYRNHFIKCISETNLHNGFSDLNSNEPNYSCSNNNNNDYISSSNDNIHNTYIKKSTSNSPESNNRKKNKHNSLANMKKHSSKSAITNKNYNNNYYINNPIQISKMEYFNLKEFKLSLDSFLLMNHVFSKTNKSSKINSDKPTSKPMFIIETDHELVKKTIITIINSKNNPDILKYLLMELLDRTLIGELEGLVFTSKDRKSVFYKNLKLDIFLLLNTIIEINSVFLEQSLTNELERQNKKNTNNNNYNDTRHVNNEYLNLEKKINDFKSNTKISEIAITADYFSNSASIIEELNDYFDKINLTIKMELLKYHNINNLYSILNDSNKSNINNTTYDPIKTKTEINFITNILIKATTFMNCLIIIINKESIVSEIYNSQDIEFKSSFEYLKNSVCELEEYCTVILGVIIDIIRIGLCAEELKKNLYTKDTEETKECKEDSFYSIIASDLINQIEDILHSNNNENNNPILLLILNQLKQLIKESSNTNTNIKDSSTFPPRSLLVKLLKAFSTTNRKIKNLIILLLQETYYKELIIMLNQLCTDKLYNEETQNSSNKKNRIYDYYYNNTKKNIIETLINYDSSLLSFATDKKRNSIINYINNKDNNVSGDVTNNSYLNSIKRKAHNKISSQMINNEQYGSELSEFGVKNNVNIKEDKYDKPDKQDKEDEQAKEDYDISKNNNRIADVNRNNKLRYNKKISYNDISFNNNLSTTNRNKKNTIINKDNRENKDYKDNNIINNETSALVSLLNSSNNNNNSYFISSLNTASFVLASISEWYEIATGIGKSYFVDFQGTWEVIRSESRYGFFVNSLRFKYSNSYLNTIIDYNDNNGASLKKEQDLPFIKHDNFISCFGSINEKNIFKYLISFNCFFKRYDCCVYNNNDGISSCNGNRIIGKIKEIKYNSCKNEGSFVEELNKEMFYSKYFNQIKINDNKSSDHSNVFNKLIISDDMMFENSINNNDNNNSLSLSKDFVKAKSLNINNDSKEIQKVNLIKIIDKRDSNCNIDVSQSASTTELSLQVNQNQRPLEINAKSDVEEMLLEKLEQYDLLNYSKMNKQLNSHKNLKEINSIKGILFNSKIEDKLKVVSGEIDEKYDRFDLELNKALLKVDKVMNSCSSNNAK